MSTTTATRKRRETQPLSQISEADCTTIMVESASDGSPTDAQIRERAYAIYLSRNGAPGDPTADWYQARRELCAEGTATASG